MAVSKQFNNRRQPVLINNIDPEILTEEKLSADGFITSTDYATAAGAPGIIKTSTSYATSMTSTGALVGVTKTLDAYNSGGAQMFICKGTLENIFQSKAMTAWINLMLAGAGVLDPDALPVGTVISDLILTKTADGYEFSATKTEP